MWYSIRCPRRTKVYRQVDLEIAKIVILLLSKGSLYPNTKVLIEIHYLLPLELAVKKSHYLTAIVLISRSASVFNSSVLNNLDIRFSRKRHDETLDLVTVLASRGGSICLCNPSRVRALAALAAPHVIRDVHDRNYKPLHLSYLYLLIVENSIGKRL